MPDLSMEKTWNLSSSIKWCSLLLLLLCILDSRLGTCLPLRDTFKKVHVFSHNFLITHSMSSSLHYQCPILIQRELRCHASSKIDLSSANGGNIVTIRLRGASVLWLATKFSQASSFTLRFWVSPSEHVQSCPYISKWSRAPHLNHHDGFCICLCCD